MNNSVTWLIRDSPSSQKRIRFGKSICLLLICEQSNPAEKKTFSCLPDDWKAIQISENLVRPSSRSITTHVITHSFFRLFFLSISFDVSPLDAAPQYQTIIPGTTVINNPSIPYLSYKTTVPPFPSVACDCCGRRRCTVSVAIEPLQ